VSNRSETDQLDFEDPHIQRRKRRKVLVDCSTIHPSGVVLKSSGRMRSSYCPAIGLINLWTIQVTNNDNTVKWRSIHLDCTWRRRTTGEGMCCADAASSQVSIPTYCMSHSYTSDQSTDVVANCCHKPTTPSFRTDCQAGRRRT